MAGGEQSGEDVIDDIYDFDKVSKFWGMFYLIVLMNKTQQKRFDFVK